jgi:hypothetical protein
MQQLEIQYFWPLTEQVSLDLDYSECLPKTSIYSQSGNWTGTNTTSLITQQYQLVIENKETVGYVKVGNTNMGLPKKPKWYSRIFYKLLGFEWKEKI